MYVALGQSDVRLKPCEERFGKFIEKCRKIYDVVIIDCHPAGSILTKTSLQNSDHVIIPVIPGRFAVRGIGLMLEFIKSKRLGTLGPKPHILFNSVPRTGDRSKEEMEIRADGKFSDKCMTTALRKYSVLTEPVGGIGFAWFSKKAYSTEAFRNLHRIAEEVSDRTETKQ
jgi:chromosome partitioning protein